MLHGLKKGLKVPLFEPLCMTLAHHASLAKPLGQVTHQGVPVRVIHSKRPKTSCTPRRDGLCKAALTGLDTLPSCISAGVAFFCNFAG